MKNLNFRNEIIKEIKAALSWAQNTSEKANFSTFVLNTKYFNFNNNNFGERIKNNSLNGYLKYNDHMKKKDQEIIYISDQLACKLEEISMKYFNKHIGNTALIDILNNKIFNIKIERMEQFKIFFQEKEKEFQIKSFYNQLSNNLKVKDAPEKRKALKI